MPMGVKVASSLRRWPRIWVCAGVLFSTLHSAQAGVAVSEMLLLGSWREKNGGGIVTAARASQHGVNRRLWEASERGSSKEIDRSLLDGAEVDSKGPGLWTALHFAARHFPPTCSVSQTAREKLQAGAIHRVDFSPTDPLWPGSGIQRAPSA